MRNRAAGSVLAVTLLGAAAPSFAQPAALPATSKVPAPAPPQADPTIRARERFTEGVQLAKKNEWQKAYDAFQEAWNLKQHPQIALNLGRAELEIGKHRDASEHLRFCLDNNPPEHPDAVLAREWLDEAKKKVVTLKITVEGAGVEVRFDGQPIGTSPLPPEVYIDPGKHTVEARSGVRRAEVTGTYQAGWMRELKLVPREGPVAGPAATASGPMPGLAGSGKPPEAPFPVRTVVLISGGAVALSGLGLGVTGLVLSGLKAAERDEFCERAADRCLTPESVDKELFDSQKGQWQQLDKERVSLGNMGIAGLVVGGIAALGTGTAFFLWKPSSSKSDTKHGLVIVPSGTGAVIRGKW